MNNTQQLVKESNSRYQVNEIGFKTKDELKDHIRQLMERYEDGDSLVGSDLEFMLELLANHPTASSKFEKDVSSLRVHHPPYSAKRKASAKGILLKYADGCVDDISWTKAVDSLGRDPALVEFLGKRSTTIKAARGMIAFQMSEFRREQFECGVPVCAVSGVRLTPKTASVDHVGTLFISILENFLSWQGVEIDSIDVIDSQTLSEKRWADPELSQSWIDYHGKHAQYRLVTLLENMRAGRHGERIKHFKSPGSR